MKKCISIYCWMYLYKLLNVFVHIARCICSNCKMMRAKGINDELIICWLLALPPLVYMLTNIIVNDMYFSDLKKKHISAFGRFVTCISLTGQWWKMMMSRKRSSHHLPASRLVSSGLQVYQLDYKFEPRHPLSSSAHTHPMKSWTLDMGGMMLMMMMLQ